MRKALSLFKINTFFLILIVFSRFLRKLEPYILLVLNIRICKFLLVFISLFSFCIVPAQQNEEFKEVKEYYDYKRALLTDAFSKEANKINDWQKIHQMQADYREFMVKLDSIQNVAMLAALIRVKNREDLAFIQRKKTPSKDSISPNLKEVPAEYPGGIDLLRKQIASMFYFDAVHLNASKMSTNIYFIVEKDGRISSVRTDGENSVFNRQAEIAVYLLPDFFSPTTINGQNVRYRFRIPLTMNFE